MRIICSFLSVKVYRRAAEITQVPRRPLSFPLEALLAAPRLAEHSIDWKTLVARERTQTGQIQNLEKKLFGDIAGHEPDPVPTEDQMILHHIVHREPHELPEELIVLQLLRQELFAPDRVQNLNEHCPLFLLVTTHDVAYPLNKSVTCKHTTSPGGTVRIHKKCLFVFQQPSSAPAKARHTTNTLFN